MSDQQPGIANSLRAAPRIDRVRGWFARQRAAAGRGLALVHAHRTQALSYVCMTAGWIEGHHEELAQYIPRGALTFLFGAAFFTIAIYNTFIAPANRPPP